jgi:hypothetical protein
MYELAIFVAMLNYQISTIGGLKKALECPLPYLGLYHHGVKPWNSAVRMS